MRGGDPQERGSRRARTTEPPRPVILSEAKDLFRSPLHKTRAAGNARLDRIIIAPDVLPRALFQFCDALIIGSCEKSGEKSVYVIPSYRLP